MSNNHDVCPNCSGEVTSMFGLAGGGEEPGVYWLCLDCDWMSSIPKNPVCFPFGLVDDQVNPSL